MELIDKDILMSKIRKLKMDIGNIFNEYDEGFWEGRTTAFDDVICAIDTLEVKEVDLVEERMKECPHKQVGCTMYEGHILECRGACSWVVDYMNLKELKQMKGGKK